MSYEMLDSKELGRRIKNAREAAGLSLNDVASRLGVNKSTILRYENGTVAKANAQLLSNLAPVIRVSAHYLLGWSDTPDEAAGVPSVDGVPLTSNECDLVMLFRQLDLLGQSAVVTKVMEELQRVKNK
ncbi:MAG: helix-turn-helix transcriptional regulator [Clostridia bacterium]|nr:helix-turn-helix transcriptional regulator [Clostridia bacterium]